MRTELFQHREKDPEDNNKFNFLTKNTMDYIKNISSKRVLELSIAVSAILIALSFFYYFIVRPINKDFKLDNCLKKAGGKYRRDECFKRF